MPERDVSLDAEPRGREAGVHRRLAVFLAATLMSVTGATQVVTSTAGWATTTHLGARGGFKPSIGMTRAQVESAFRSVPGTSTVFARAGSIKGVPRVLGHDERLFTVVEINGYPEVVDVQVVTVLDTHRAKTLEKQVMYDSLACGELAGRSAQAWCLGRALNTRAHHLVTATTSRSFGPLRITVHTFQKAHSSAPPLVEVNIAAT